MPARDPELRAAEVPYRQEVTRAQLVEARLKVRQAADDVHFMKPSMVAA